MLDTPLRDMGGELLYAEMTPRSHLGKQVKEQNTTEMLTLFHIKLWFPIGFIAHANMHCDLTKYTHIKHSLDL